MVRLREQKAENAAYVAAELFSGGATPSLRSVFRSVSRTLRSPHTPHQKQSQARCAPGDFLKRSCYAGFKHALHVLPHLRALRSVWTEPDLYRP